jgi:Tfp pilus assembly protein PilV
MMRASRLRSPRRRGGFTMVEVVIASALLGFSLVVMFGFHSQALRANMNARRMTDCTYLAQTQMERLLSMDWESAARPSDMLDGGNDASAAGENDALEWPSAPVEVTGLNSVTPTTLSSASYTVTWDVEDMDTNATWVRLRVRCTYEDSAFNTLHGTTISSFRYRDS